MDYTVILSPRAVGDLEAIVQHLKPYRIVYRVEEDKKRISIARFWHMAQENLEL